jgi:transcription elongation factor GreA
MVHEIVHLTREGYRKFEEELQHLLTVRREEVAGRLHQALEEGGELIENAEYADAKNEQAFVEGRIQELESILSRARIIEDEESNGPPDSVRLNSVVTIQEEGYDPEKFRIVGNAEAAPREGLISNDSPLGKALWGKKVGDEACVEAPDGEFKYRILSIE